MLTPPDDTITIPPGLIGIKDFTDLGPGALYVVEDIPDSPLDRVKSAILELPSAHQHEIYKFLYTLGHRMF